MAQQPQPTNPNFPYVDLPQISETYVDSVYRMVSDGQSVKITFTVTRMETLEGQTSPAGKRYTACRLVLPLTGAAALSDQLNRLAASIAQARGGSAKTD